ncbi:MAG: GTPase ObgE [Thermoleophilaceae bacterium]|nr:GTPase ObgE [Thermoleophilaceae bacterium]
MFYDRARIFVEAGAGGSGCVSFRREAHVPRGGPDGGDGGDGADVVLVCDDSLRDLAAFRRSAHFRAARGGHGEGSNRHGASPPPLEVAVPPGTVVEDPGHEARYDLTAAGQRVSVAAGGDGGHGNKRFAKATRQAPRFAERGLDGEQGWLELRLKLLADAGLVGLPNAGKSSLLARLTSAHPKVADYPFTTLEPVLGTLELDDRQLVVADIPGLIEGASEGVGLGHEFLAHVERTRLLIHVLDQAPLDGSDPERNFEAVESELSGYGAELEELPRIVCLSKADLVPAEDAAAAVEHWRERLGSRARVVLATSAMTGEGLDGLAAAIARELPAPVATATDPSSRGPGGGDSDGVPALRATHRTFRPGADDAFEVERAGEGFRVKGRAVERLLARHDTSNEEALRYVEDRLRSLGVIKALEAAGFEPGDDVEIGGETFELDPGAPFG